MTSARYRWLVLGGSGMLGTACRRYLEATGESELLAPTSHALNICDPNALYALIDSWQPSHVINCAAYTNVDSAERFRARCTLVNSAAAASLAELAATRNFRLSQVSTASVFNGPAGSVHQPNSTPRPANFYSVTKVEAENACFRFLQEGAFIQVPRVYWLFDSSGTGFTKSILETAKQSGSINIVSGQHGQPTHTSDAAALIVDAIRDTDFTGPIHATPRGSASREEWGLAICEAAGLRNVQVKAVDPSYFKANACRPTDCTLSWDTVDRAGFPAVDWKEGVQRLVRSFSSA